MFHLCQNTKRGERLIQITTGTGESTHEKVLAAAEERQEKVVHFRMLVHPDLLSFDAKYHRFCYSPYVSKRNIAFAQRKAKDPFESAFADLTRFIDQTIFTSKSVTTLVEVLSS